jgi:hypothetical protein
LVAKVEKHLGILEHNSWEEGGVLQLLIDHKGSTKILAVFTESDF